MSYKRRHPFNWTVQLITNQVSTYVHTWNTRTSSVKCIHVGHFTRAFWFLFFCRLSFLYLCICFIYQYYYYSILHTRTAKKRNIYDNRSSSSRKRDYYYNHHHEPSSSMPYGSSPGGYRDYHYRPNSNNRSHNRMFTFRGLFENTPFCRMFGT